MNLRNLPFLVALLHPLLWVTTPSYGILLFDTLLFLLGAWWTVFEVREPTWTGWQPEDLQVDPSGFWCTLPEPFAFDERRIGRWLPYLSSTTTLVALLINDYRYLFGMSATQFLVGIDRFSGLYGLGDVVAFTGFYTLAVSVGLLILGRLHPPRSRSIEVELRGRVLYINREKTLFSGTRLALNEENRSLHVDGLSLHSHLHALRWLKDQLERLDQEVGDRTDIPEALHHLS